VPPSCVNQFRCTTAAGFEGNVIGGLLFGFFCLGLHYYVLVWEVGVSKLLDSWNLLLEGVLRTRPLLDEDCCWTLHCYRHPGMPAGLPCLDYLLATLYRNTAAVYCWRNAVCRITVFAANQRRLWGKSIFTVLWWACGIFFFMLYIGQWFVRCFNFPQWVNCFQSWICFVQKYKSPFPLYFFSKIFLHCPFLWCMYPVAIFSTTSICKSFLYVLIYFTQQYIWFAQYLEEGLFVVIILFRPGVFEIFVVCLGAC